MNKENKYEVDGCIQLKKYMRSHEWYLWPNNMNMNLETGYLFLKKYKCSREQ